MHQITSLRRSRGRLLALGVLTAAFVFSLTVGCSCSIGTQKVTVGAKDEVRYSGTATAEEAKALGESLKAQLYLQDQGVTVVLAKGSDGASIGYVVQEGAWDNDDNVVLFEQMTRVAGPKVGGLPVKLQLMNTKLEVKKESLVHANLKAGANDEISYSGTSTEQDAKALAEQLKSIGYLQDRGTSVLLSKGPGGTVVSFVVRDGAWSNDDTVANFEQIGHSIAASVGGAPIKVRMLNTQLKKQKEIPIS
ncbi:MAG TPA: hypothetical protein VEU96_12945 [Bryobacteraceae bacterium]|nr:hypothetical protein [Bryobacteraceae bacterium]